MNTTSDLIDKIIDDHNYDATEQVLNLLYAKAQQALDIHKQEVANMMFTQPEEN